MSHQEMEPSLDLHCLLRRLAILFSHKFMLIIDLDLNQGPVLVVILLSAVETTRIRSPCVFAFDSTSRIRLNGPRSSAVLVHAAEPVEQLFDKRFILWIILAEARLSNLSSVDCDGTTRRFVEEFSLILFHVGKGKNISRCLRVPTSINICECERP